MAELKDISSLDTESTDNLQESAGRALESLGTKTDGLLAKLDAILVGAGMTQAELDALAEAAGDDLDALEDGEADGGVGEAGPARGATAGGPWGSSWTGAQRSLLAGTARLLLATTTTTTTRQALHEIANGMAQNRDELSWLESLAGKPISQAAEDIDASIECVRHFAGFADRIQGKYFAAHPGFESFTVREPVGVCGLITSFNYPLRKNSSLCRSNRARRLACV
nr:hypothetical protein HK105_006722 [Polyrhizophydium stewartii]